MDALALAKKGAVKIGPFGSQLKKNELKEQGIKVFGQENVIRNDFRIGERFIDHPKFDTLRSVQLFPGDVVLTMMGSLGAATVVPDGTPTGIMDSHLLRVQPDTFLVEPEFLARVLRDSAAIKKQILARSQGGIMSGLNAKIVRTLEVPIPPLLEQRKIAAILSSVDDAIEKTQAVIDQVQVVKRGLMQELLTRGLPGQHTRFKQTEIGETPEEWRLVPLQHVGTWSSGGTPSKKEPRYWTGSIPWVSPKDMKRDRIADTIDHVSREAIGNGIRVTPRDSILIVVRGMILAHTFPVAITLTDVAFNQDMKALVAGEHYDPEFLLYWLENRQERILRLVDTSSHGTKRLPTAKLFAELAPCPPGNEQKRIARSLRSCDSYRDRALTERASMVSVKDALTSVLLTGELRVTPDADTA